MFHIYKKRTYFAIDSSPLFQSHFGKTHINFLRFIVVLFLEKLLMLESTDSLYFTGTVVFSFLVGSSGSAKACSSYQSLTQSTQIV
jgi:hypothetical protein